MIAFSALLFLLENLLNLLLDENFALGLDFL